MQAITTQKEQDKARYDSELQRALGDNERSLDQLKRKHAELLEVCLTPWPLGFLYNLPSQTLATRVQASKRERQEDLALYCSQLEPAKNEKEEVQRRFDELRRKHDGMLKVRRWLAGCVIVSPPMPLWWRPH